MRRLSFSDYSFLFGSIDDGVVRHLTPGASKSFRRFFQQNDSFRFVNYGSCRFAKMMMQPKPLCE
jgi:hypothetical protein